MTNLNKSLTVKDWFANKVANEMHRNIFMCDVFGILKETEKAVYAMLNVDADTRKTMWVPKSVLVEREVGEVEGEYGYNHPTYRFDSYEEASRAFTSFWSDYR